MSYIVSTSILGIQTFVTRFDPSAALDTAVCSLCTHSTLAARFALLRGCAAARVLSCTLLH